VDSNASVPPDDWFLAPFWMEFSVSSSVTPILFSASDLWLLFQIMAGRAAAAAKRAELAGLIAEAFELDRPPSAGLRPSGSAAAAAPPSPESRIPSVMAAIEGSSTADEAMAALRVMRPPSPPAEEDVASTGDEEEEEAGATDDEALFEDVAEAMADADALLRRPAPASPQKAPTPPWLAERRVQQRRGGPSTGTAPRRLQFAGTAPKGAAKPAGSPSMWTCDVCGASNALPAGVALQRPRPEDEFMVRCRACATRPLSSQ
jgi:hypothetical protein